MSKEPFWTDRDCAISFTVHDVSFISKSILEYFSDNVQADESPSGAKKRNNLKKEIVRFAEVIRDRKAMLDRAYDILYHGAKWGEE